ncbi:two-component system sensor histidine kinase YesM [Paenibacillus cellulosilyticus]|uniref:histidine kinase n=1 Tax=Paenibacillus cellulosilyticus TaxID=375489 RepID=A0A2V2YQ92_9BACL|nr:sensor histidine kinase [Paenibacillus cellulosilyticus]PWV98618.1 two-component system sensor histidine kinase YesM [Paenibacillus cellulosilyticus]QKS43864.1 sensor histidine kinase [Paenibacillus cellulosilyticus]
MAIKLSRLTQQLSPFRTSSLGTPQPDKRSLRRTVVVYVLIGSLLPLALLSLMTYNLIYNVMTNKVQTGIEATLKQEAASLENTINNLDFASKQFALDGGVVDEVAAFLQEPEVYKKLQIMTRINEKINLVNFTNPYLGVTAYIMPKAEDPVLFSNLNLYSDVSFDKLPPFTTYNGGNYYGPHRTMYSASDNTVFSVVRKVRMDDDSEVYVYLETNYNQFRKILNNESYGIKVSHLLINGDGESTYIDLDDKPELGLNAKWKSGEPLADAYKGYRDFRYTSPQGWQLVTLVKKSAFNSEINAWFVQLGLLAFATLGFAVLLALLIWRWIYRPLNKVNQQIVRMSDNRTTPVSFTNVEEFDLLLTSFKEMKTRINDLIGEVEHKEKEKSRIEIEKLLSQINPHFLHNTLNTVQWLARMNGQKEIDRLVTLLVKVLQYNLGKQSLIVTMREEIEAVQNYMELQRIRYDYEFEFSLELDDAAMAAAVPRFLLQPLVENAIYHGASESNGCVTVAVRSADGDRLMLVVEDNGEGISEEKARKLLEEDPEGRKQGLGIGLSYVNRMLKRFYGEQATMHIGSKPGEGTVIAITIPRRTKEEFHD